MLAMAKFSSVPSPLMGVLEVLFPVRFTVTLRIKYYHFFQRIKA